jgi:hypothetical protein
MNEAASNPPFAFVGYSLLAIFMVVIMLIYRHGWANRHVKSLQRVATSFEERYQRYYGSVERVRPQYVREILQVIANEIDIEPTRVRPADLLEKDFCMRAIDSDYWGVFDVLRTTSERSTSTFTRCLTR